MSNELTQMASLPLAPEKVLQGRVAQILNARELVINIGADKGVQPRMKFAILTGVPTDVHDPETGELLDTVVREKVRVEAVEVRPKITICRTYRTTTTRVTGADRWNYIFGSQREEVKEVETLRAVDASFLSPLSPNESYVKIGDSVIRVSE